MPLGELGLRPNACKHPSSPSRDVLVDNFKRKEVRILSSSVEVITWQFWAHPGFLDDGIEDRELVSCRTVIEIKLQQVITK